MNSDRRRQQSRTRGGANSSTQTISGEKLNRSISISGKFSLAILCIVIEFFSPRKYNCDTFIVIGIALFLAFNHLPKISKQMYKYEFVVSVGNKKQILKVELPYSSINPANISAKYTILNIQADEMGLISRTDQELEVSLELDGNEIGALTLESDCFNIGEQEYKKNWIFTTDLTIKGKICVSIDGKKVDVINNIPILTNTIVY
jgi:hypothetical protein